MNLSSHYVALRLGIQAETPVLDVGGAANPFPFGTVTVVDVSEPEDPCHQFHKKDICKEALPFGDKEFEVCICSQTIEDLYNPSLVLDEIRRVSKSGYLETPHRGAESCFGVSPELGLFPGWGHHRWMLESTEPNSFRIICKMWQLMRHDLEKIALWSGPSSFEFFWQGTFDYELVNTFDQTGDRWNELARDHEEFIARNRHYITTIKDLENMDLKALAKECPAGWSPAMFQSTSKGFFTSLRYTMENKEEENLLVSEEEKSESFSSTC
jgi:hypothetical protein